MQTSKSLDIQGHRGCRGLLPENTIPAFQKALELGVTTIELDVVITGDDKVLVSHEPWFSHEIATGPGGDFISKAHEKAHNIFKMVYAETQAYDVGLKPHPRFPDQIKIAVIKPLFSDAISATEAYAVSIGAKKPRYNVEIKFETEEQDVFYPSPQLCARLVVAQIESTGFKNRFVVQSFSKEVLKNVRKMDPDIELALLIENSQSPEENLESLGFTPAIYSPDYQLVDENLIAFCKEKQMQLIPWTVNDTGKMKRLILLGVDGIITDFPDRLVALAKQMKIEVK
jgi:glycerophosphoryl diester phosphodiesterase